MSIRRPLNPEEQSAIDSNAALIVREASKASGSNLGYNETSVAWMDDYIESRRGDLDAELLEKSVDVFGSCLGECVRHQYGGQWRVIDWEMAVLFNESNAVFPFSRVAKHFRNGREDSILSWFITIPLIFNAERPEESRETIFLY
jgi:hypothetical protein